MRLQGAAVLDFRLHGVWVSDVQSTSTASRAQGRSCLTSYLVLPDTSWTVRCPDLYAIRLMDKILHDLKDSKLWELWYIPCNG